MQGAKEKSMLGPIERLGEVQRQRQASYAAYLWGTRSFRVLGRGMPKAILADLCAMAEYSRKSLLYRAVLKKSKLRSRLHMVCYVRVEAVP